MEKLFVLMKNHKLKFVDENELKKLLNEKFNKIEMILIKITTNEMDGWIPITPNSILSELHSGTVTYRLVSRYIDYSSHYSQSEKIKKVTMEFNSISELYNILHSIDNIDYVNSIIGANVEGTCDLYVFDISTFEIDIYDSKFESIFHVKFIRDRKNDEYGWYSNVYKLLRDIYHPLYNMEPLNHLGLLELNVVDMKWDWLKDEDLTLIQENPVHYNIIGIFGEETSIFYTMNEERFQAFLLMQVSQLSLISAAYVDGEMRLPNTFTYTGVGVGQCVELINMLLYIIVSVMILTNTNKMKEDMGVLGEDVKYKFNGWIDITGSNDTGTASFSFTPNTVPSLEMIETRIRTIAGINTSMKDGETYEETKNNWI